MRRSAGEETELIGVWVRERVGKVGLNVAVMREEEKEKTGECGRRKGL